MRSPRLTDQDPARSGSDPTRSVVRHAMRHAFPYRFEPQDSGVVLVQFVDVPEAHTSGASEAEAGGERALDCLVAALGGYIKLGREIPPSSPARGRPVIILPPGRDQARALRGDARAA